MEKDDRLSSLLYKTMKSRSHFSLLDEFGRSLFSERPSVVICFVKPQRDRSDRVISQNRLKWQHISEQGCHRERISVLRVSIN